MGLTSLRDWDSNRKSILELSRRFFLDRPMASVGIGTSSIVKYGLYRYGTCPSASIAVVVLLGDAKVTSNHPITLWRLTPTLDESLAQICPGLAG